MILKYNKNYEGPRTIILEDMHKYKLSTLSDALNQEDDNHTLIEIKGFGINHVYTIININKFKKFINTIKDYNKEITISISRSTPDMPLVDRINIIGKRIIPSEIQKDYWVSLIQMNCITTGMTMICDKYLQDDIYHELSIGDNIIDSLIDVNLISDIPYKYIILYGADKYEFSNTIYTKDFEGIFVKIPEFNCWQYISKKKYDNLTSVKNITLKYAITDTPRCFSKVSYFQEFEAETLDEILRYCIYCPMDIYFNKLFDQKDSAEFGYDAIEIISIGREYSTSVILTYDEIGIFPRFTTSWNDKYRNNIGENFNLLKLINKVISLKP